MREFKVFLEESYSQKESDNQIFRFAIKISAF